MTDLDDLIFDIRAAKELEVISHGYYQSTVVHSPTEMKILALMERLAIILRGPAAEGYNPPGIHC